ncbi:SAM-dependent methyltransferase [Sulfuriroseicoccus oceanibius]|uniref:Class I SAM-dependent methyltransferase n=1 Tax=Sulfuriroseicoccus oceanibius TaxID=2707525 RepID=A0A6B3LDD8_9BACT|nr:methyltransferase domain-containing protein [Sulfuriroseicoccus oceanibius]QQL45158.1 class I SAM-dependent methyltransferase [Sulfuriroseicoccus oceanibius]
MPLPEQVASSNVARHYDELDPVYRAVWGDALHHGLWTTGRESLGEAVDALECELVAALGQAGVNGGRVVDVGCGNGVLSGRLQHELGVEVVGVTVSPVQAARAAEDPSLRIVCGDWMQAADGLGLFDALVEVEALGHLASVSAFFDQAALSVAPGGVVVMSDYLATDRGWCDGSRTLMRLCEHGRLTGLATRNEVVAAAVAAGFELEDDRDWSEHVAPTWSVLQRRMWTRAWRSAGVWRALARVRRWSDLRVGALAGMLRGYERGWLEYRMMVFRR